MITELGSALELLEGAGPAAAALLPAGEPLTCSPIAVEELALPAAVVVPFTGAVSGELALLVDNELAAAMRGATIGEVNLALALAPTLDAMAAALGPVVMGPGQAMDARLATARIASHGEVAATALRSATAIRAAVILGIDAPVAGGPDGGGPGTTGNALDRMDLLRGVEMAASVELGRARMTVNDLLALRSGSVIELDRAAGEAADLFVNGRLIARGEVVVVDENYALRITQIVTEDGR